MTKNSLKLISAALVLALSLFALTGCSLLKDIGSAFSEAIEDEISDEDEVDFEDIINEITTSTIRSTVTLVTTYYNQNIFGVITNHATSQGSGTVVMRSADSSTCYALTNAHCVADNAAYANKSIAVTDCRGNIYKSAAVYQGSISEKYDLAIIEFECSNEDVQHIPLAEANPKIDDTVISLGSPHGQMNFITIGEVITYYEGELIEPEALYHSAPVGAGGSGGALLNTELELCGVNFASDDTEEDFGNASAIPIESVREYLAELEIFSKILG